jgi:glycosyltransferase involved in cell wall biosynthesis
MRVCFICGNLYPLLAGRSDIPIIGGAEVQQRLIANELTRHGATMSFVTEDFGQGPEWLVDAGPIYSYRFGRNKLVQASTLWRALARADADVYYVRGLPKFIGLLGAFSVARRRPLVVGLSCDEGACARDQARISWPVFASYRWVLARAAAVVAQTEKQQRGLARYYGVLEPLRIPNGTILPLTPPAAPPEGGAIVWVGSLHRRKGVEGLFRLAALLPKRRFEIVGGPARSELAYYQEKRAEAERLPNVKWRGQISNEGIDEVFSGALALAHTGVTQAGAAIKEGFPNVYLEAWRNGVPVVTLNYDPDEVICRNDLGSHCDTVEAMAAALERLAEDPERRRRLASVVREYVAREHDMIRIGETYWRLFSRLARDA